MEAGRLALDRIDFDLDTAGRAGRGDRGAAAAAKGVSSRCGLRPRCRARCTAIPAGCARSCSICSATRSSSRARAGSAWRRPGRGRPGLGVRLEITVSDPGIGIPEHLQAGLFTAYAQADPSIPPALWRQRPRSHDLQAPGRADGRRGRPLLGRARAPASRSW